jgi:hypothetical protein
MVGCAVTFIAAVVGWQWAGSKREDLAQWLMAGAAVATLLAAIGAGVFAAGAFTLETEREDRYRDDQRRYQAARFAAWYDVIHEEIDTGSLRGTQVRRIRVIRARNASDLPVTSVRFLLAIDGQRVATHWVPLVPPSAEPVDLPLSHDAIWALDSVEQNLRDDHPDADYLPAITVHVAFRDAAGQRWTRTHEGDLTPVKDDKA